jgi:hypothetical protein
MQLMKFERLIMHICHINCLASPIQMYNGNAISSDHNSRPITIKTESAFEKLIYESISFAT